MTKFLLSFFLPFIMLILLIPAKLAAQKTLMDFDPIMTFKQADDLFGNKMYNASIVKFKEYIEKNDNNLLNSISYLNIALAAGELKHTNTEELFSDYLEKYPEQNKQQFVYFSIGKYRFYSKKFEDAQEWFNKIEEPEKLESDAREEYYFMAGYCHFREKEYDKALTCFNKIDENLNPYFNYANYYKGYIFYVQGKYQDALVKFNRLENDIKFKAIIPVYITHVKLNLKLYREVLDYGAQSLAMPKIQKSSEIKSYMAEAYFQLGQYADAIEIYKTLKDGNFTFSETDYYYYGFCLVKQDKCGEAIGILTSIAIKENKLGQNVAYLLAGCYLKSNEKYKARNLYLFASGINEDKDLQELSKLNYAKLSYELGFYRETINVLQSFTKGSQSSRYKDEAKSLMGQILLATYNYKEALEILETISDRNEELKQAYQQLTYYYGLEFFQNNNYGEARDLFIKSVKENANRRFSALGYFWLAESYYQLNQPQAALREYKNFLNMPEAIKTPYFSLGYYNSAYVNFKNEDYRNARLNFEKYIDLESSGQKNERYYDAIIRIADCSFAVKDYPNALEKYNIIIKNSRQELDYAYFQMGTIYGLTNNDDMKMEMLTTLTQRFPNSPYSDDAKFEIGYTKYLKDNFQGALEEFTVLRNRFPNSPYVTSAILMMGYCYGNLNQEDKALEKFKEIISTYPHSPEYKEAINGIKDIYIDRADADGLTAFMNTLPKVNSSRSSQDSAIYSAAFTHVKKGNYEEAIKALQAYLSSYPDGYFIINANYYIASCADFIKKPDLALKYYEAVIRMSPNEFAERAVKASALSFYNKKNYDTALIRFSQLESLSNTRENTLISIQGQMRCYYKLEKYESCLSFADKTLALNYLTPFDKTEALYYSGKCYYAQNNYDKALAQFKLVTESTNIQFGPEAMYLIANIYFIKENYDETINTIIKLKDTYPVDEYHIAKGFILLSDVFVKSGDLFQAKATLKSIIENYEGAELLAIAKEKMDKIIELEKKPEIKPEIEPESETKTE